MTLFNAKTLVRTGLALAACAVIGGTALKAEATPIGFDLSISGDFNVPLFSLTNQSASAQLVAFDVTIGNTSCTSSNNLRPLSGFDNGEFGSSLVAV
jgi:hypothetical protein